MPTQLNNFKLSSQLLIQHLDTLIIQITKAISVEYGIKPDPDAKEAVRKILLERVHALMSDESLVFLKDYVSSKMKDRQAINDNEFIKLMGADYVAKHF